MACSHCASQPPARAPAAVANDPARLYQPNSLVRRLSGTSWESAACSMDRKGPISPPLGLTMPMIAARVIHTGLVVQRKTRPDRIISAAPSRSMFLRPNRSATMVTQRETRISPARVAVRTAPTPVAPNPVAARYRASTTEMNP